MLSEVKRVVEYEKYDGMWHIYAYTEDAGNTVRGDLGKYDYYADAVAALRSSFIRR